ncbi:MAG: thiolase family protein [Candidatus Marinimicrobia bacterium]|jgi:acetyl-CoA acetyltransferase family protein|nr:thiolase family protein [Candidatus Neomarinimicrobiota bacterium]MBT3633309.1 thiolase family protein [Candidatus Neomarinimicrobiota bacterium]MBT3681452.1 thiolase family protein [Candidatus Neomarinimicrobiota bacterium]MBT3758581.1 thiolase family protein [Candidatus Neomarinimicrobiota bacterium]MBT3894765.1 thiolase family protein [Candidatus Neomarinimicrobiota bacterium]
MKEYTVIVDGLRSPIGIKSGKMLGIRPDDLAADIIGAMMVRNPSVPKELIEDVVIGCAFPEGSQGMLVARGISILADLPVEAGAKVVNRFCGSSMDAVHQVSQAIDTGDIETGIAGGVEDMFGVPMGGFNPSFHPVLYEEEYYMGMGETAENLAADLEISREDQEEFSIDSHKKALSAIENGRFDNELHKIEFNDEVIRHDEGPREPNIEKIKSLSPAFDDNGSITAATASPVSIGAAALLLMGSNKAESLGIKPEFKILSRAVAGVDWKRMGAGPLPATEKALAKAGLSMADIDVIELNEAFAAQSLYVIRKGGWDMSKINLNGGAIALGHPLGCSGARILVTLMNVMRQKEAKIGLATMCIGTGQGIATIIERLS